MHELSVSAAVVDTAVRHAAGRKVTSVHLRVGALRQVVPDSLAFYFEIVSRETVCEGARLEQELVAACLRCEECETEWAVDVPAFRIDTTAVTNAIHGAMNKPIRNENGGSHVMPLTKTTFLGGGGAPVATATPTTCSATSIAASTPSFTRSIRRRLTGCIKSDGIVPYTNS